MSVSDAKRLKELEIENGRLKKLLADALLENEVPREVLRKVVTAPARRAAVREMVTGGLCERRALAVVRMSAAAPRYAPRPDPDPGLRDRIVALAHRHRRYGAGMIYLKLRQEGAASITSGWTACTPKRVCRCGGDAARKSLWSAASRSPGPTRPTMSGQRTSSSIGPLKGAS
jgi:hypothetical protein